MAYIVNNKQIRQVSVLTEPNSYQTNIKPEDMQSGSTCVSKGEIITGTGRAFEFATYGCSSVYSVRDMNDNAKFGILIPEPAEGNILFVSAGSNGDLLTQDTYVIDVEQGSVVIIGKNRTTESDIHVYYSDGFLCVYIDDLSATNTALNYFEGKDNLI